MRSIPICLAAVVLSLGFAAARPGEVSAQSAETALQTRDGRHDFDFEFGSWTVRLSRLARPLTGSTEWVVYDGTSVVRPVWGGLANLGELAVEGPTGRILGLSMRLYNPQSGQWNIYWANSADGRLGEAMVGGFDGDEGRFHNQEMFNGRAVLVRFIFSEMTEDSFRLEQAFSPDGGRTWEANWIAEFARADG